MELRVYNEVDFIETPTGRIPKYEGLKRLFKEVFSKDYTQEDFDKQFMIRIPENLAKIDRIKRIYQTQVSDTPKIIFEVLDEQRQRLNRAREKYGDYISPYKL
jgi:phosphoenolpyruvate carboxykinase (GTP)